MSIKNISLGVVIISIVFFTIIALMAIWEVFNDGDFVWKALTSLAVIGFSGLVGIVIGDKMEKNRVT
jgi:hypothetical protein